MPNESGICSRTILYDINYMRVKYWISTYTARLYHYRAEVVQIKIITFAPQEVIWIIQTIWRIAASVAGSGAASVAGAASATRSTQTTDTDRSTGAPVCTFTGVHVPRGAYGS